ncbi:Linoleate 9S-lipoxygenase-4 [Glycine max]|nr:Linoleate 9S-lipoxygenase-4 [Glycine max]
MDQFLRPDLAYFKAQAAMIVSVCLDSALVFCVGNSFLFRFGFSFVGVAIKDPSAPHGVRLLIEDYPYASDGLEIWDAIKSWVEEYVSFYYKSAEELQKDPELQAWWKELVEVGHGDLKDKPWWQKMQTREELYPYGGLILNRPTISRRFMPEKGSPEYDALAKNPEKEFLKTITARKRPSLTLQHASDEFYLGQRDGGDYWTSDAGPLEAFKRFGKNLEEIEKKLIEKNNDETLRNRYGPAKMPYTLLYPSSEEGLTFRGIPNMTDKTTTTKPFPTRWSSLHESDNAIIIHQLTTTLIYTIDQKTQVIDQRNKSSKVGSLTGVIAILAITSKHSNIAATLAINALQFTHIN